jgi:hypothetical protein
MRELEIDQVVGKLLAIGAALTSVFILSGLNTDPVNVTKLFVAGIFGVAAGLIVLTMKAKQLFLRDRFLAVLAIFFLVALVNSVLNSGAPVSQSIYGAYGRNTGALTYLIMLFIMIGGLILSSGKSIAFSLYSLIAAGIINVLYCAWVLSFGDFIKWNNPYGNILGLFGNPNFISSFLGMFITGATALVFKSDFDIKRRVILLLLSTIALYEIVQSHSIQGLVVTAGGATLIGFFLVRSNFKSRVIPIIYSGFALILGFIAILGTLQKGPFTFLYKRSVSLRGTYWETGLNMGQQKPLDRYWHGYLRRLV